MRPADLLRHVWLTGVIANVAVLAALLATLQMTPVYESQGTYVIGPAAVLTQPETIVRSFDSLQGQGIVPTLVELLSSRAVAQRVAGPLGVAPQELEDYEVRANVLSSSNTLQLTVVGPDAAVTSALAIGIGREASAVFERLYSVYEIEPLDQPERPEEPVSPSLFRNCVLALLLGLSLGVAVAFLRERHRRTGRWMGLSESAPAAVEQPSSAGAATPAGAPGGQRRSH